MSTNYHADMADLAYVANVCPDVTTFAKAAAKFKDDWEKNKEYGVDNVIAALHRKVESRGVPMDSSTEAQAAVAKAKKEEKEVIEAISSLLTPYVMPRKRYGR